MDQQTKYSFRSFSEFYKYGLYIILIHELLGIFLATIACLAGSFLMMGGFGNYSAEAGGAICHL
jgi:hypothetical protein